MYGIRVKLTLLLGIILTDLQYFFSFLLLPLLSLQDFFDGL